MNHNNKEIVYLSLGLVYGRSDSFCFATIDNFFNIPSGHPTTDYKIA